MRLRRVFVFTAIAALGTGLLVYWLLMTMLAPGQVVIATAGIGARTALAPEMLTVVRMPRAGIHPDAVRRIDEVVGRVPMYPLAAGEQILAGKLVDGVLAGRISGMLAEGERAMLIPAAADRAVGGAIGPHDMVDVIFVANSAKLGYELTQTILSDVEVLDVRSGHDTLTPGSGSEGVIVRVTPKAAEALSFAISNGDIFVTLAGQSRGVVSAPDQPR